MLSWVEGCDVVEHGEGAGGGGAGADVGACVVLDAEAEGDVEELGTGGRLGKIVG